MGSALRSVSTVTLNIGLHNWMPWLLRSPLRSGQHEFHGPSTRMTIFLRFLQVAQKASYLVKVQNTSSDTNLPRSTILSSSAFLE